MRERKGQKLKRRTIFQQLISIHWWMASLYLLLIIGGMAMDRVSTDSLLRPVLYSVHKSIGLLTVVLLSWRLCLLIRVWWRKYRTRFLKLTFNWFKKTILHSLLYVFMVVTPATGIFLSNSVRAGNLRFFGIPLPDIFPPNREVIELAADLHVWSISAFFGLFLLHLAAQWKVLRSQWRRCIQWFGRLTT